MGSLINLYLIVSSTLGNYIKFDLFKWSDTIQIKHDFVEEWVEE